MTRHTFIAYRDDRVEESQPIQFDDDQWRGYVPIRVLSGGTTRLSLIFPELSEAISQQLGEGLD